MFIILDLLALIGTSLFAIGLRFDFDNIPIEYFQNAYMYLAVDALILVSVFSVFKLYTSMWSFASIMELINVFYACVLFEISTFVYKNILYIRLPRSYYLIQVMLLFIIVGAIRYSFRIKKTIKNYFDSKRQSINTMIVGAGDAGRLLIDEIINNRGSFSNRIVCVIDDNKEKIGSYIKRIPIVGSTKDIADKCRKYQIEEIIIAIPSAPKSVIAGIVKECHKTKCRIKILPEINKLMDTPTMKEVRALSYEDFLGRDEIVVDNDEISDSLKDKAVLVTGGGGSIGSELCRQIARCNPNKLIIFDIYENNAYEIEQELKRTYPELELLTIIGSVRDYDRLEIVFKEYKPDIVFHAAAHKHVPLMEYSPNEAVKNNCLGTLNTVKLSDKYGVSKFVLISTDKAVRPTNVMGATKRICEMIIQSYDKKSKTEYVAVRFGNVLGSNGSVIPLFLKQIESGGPVTVTDKRITRFFMTIPEAVSLVLQASVYAKGGQIFILDMGEPVKIYDLAKQLIIYKGYEPDQDIKIEITGLRPGEKLYEEILMNEEGLQETPNKLIHIAKPIDMNYKVFLKSLDKLIEHAYLNKSDIKDKLEGIVPTYKQNGKDK